MSIEIVLYPSEATKDQLRNHLVSCGFVKCEHLWDWGRGSLSFAWFEERDFKSFDGVEATIYDPGKEKRDAARGCRWALHTRTRASASSFDRAQQNYVIRTARKAFGGRFHNDWHGTNRYTPIEPDQRGAAGRGIYLSYERVREDIAAVKWALPEPSITLESNDKLARATRRQDPVRRLYSALIPFAVAALEHFFGQTFRVLLRYDTKAQARLNTHKAKVPMEDVLRISAGRTTVEDVVARSHNFQGISGIHKAFDEWFQIDFWKMIRRRKRVGKRVLFLQGRLQQIIEFRHGVIHRFEFDPDLDRAAIEEILDVTMALIEVFVDHLERAKGLRIRD